jgi:lipopolysaccharide/colanic/teichoic acid biosynthesis glycosyltransferase
VNNILPLERAGRTWSRAWTGTDVAARIRDVVLATILLLLLTPSFLVIALAVAVSSPGPILFRQTRVGRGRRPFVMLKFRTMAFGSDDRTHREFVTHMFLESAQTQDDESGSGNGLCKLVEDERVTRVGRLLRRLSLDELPQLFNVRAGHMSLVGPRPPLPWEVELFQTRHLVRFNAKPGMTGLWQVRGRSTLTMPQALDIDVEYIERRSFWLDLSILLRTLPAVFSGRGAS